MVKNVGALGVFFVEKFCVPVSHHMNQFFFCDDSGCKHKGDSVFVEVFVGNKGNFKVRRPAFVFVVDFAPEFSCPLGKSSRKNEVAQGCNGSYKICLSRSVFAERDIKEIKTRKERNKKLAIKIAKFAWKHKHEIIMGIKTLAKMRYDYAFFSSILSTGNINTYSINYNGRSRSHPNCNRSRT